MRSYIRGFAFPVIVMVAAASAAPLRAQSPVLLQLQSPGGDRVRVDSSGALVAIGSPIPGTCKAPVTGNGTRLMWYPCKGAFRAGDLHGLLGQDLWDDAKVGMRSWAGGDDTEASGSESFAFGSQVKASGNGAVVFGSLSSATGDAAFAAGAYNTCGGVGCVALGFSTTAAADHAVAIGQSVTADGAGSLALGNWASANKHAGSFTWGDGSSDDEVKSQADNEFRVRAAGGIRLRTSAAANAAAGVNGNTGCDLPAGSGSWTCASSRYVKENVADVDGETLLEKVSAMPVTTWNYIAEGKDVRHMGPFAQDFYAAFQLGTDSTSIGMIDINGVNLAAVKALAERTAELKAAQAALDEKVRRIDELEERVARLERVLLKKHK
jgi:hypothetical protein